MTESGTAAMRHGQSQALVNNAADNAQVHTPGSAVSESGDGYFGLREQHSHSPGSVRSNMSIQMPPATSGAVASLTAMQYLPIPIIVLSPNKTVISANEAMGKLMGVDLDILAPQRDNVVTISDVLRGQNVSQLGIDIIQRGSPIMMNWVDFLDSVVEQATKQRHETEDPPQLPSGESTPTAEYGNRDVQSKPEIARLSSSNLASTTVFDTSIDVMISPHAETVAASQDRKHPDRKPMAASMIITLWKIDDDQYFTFTFTSSAAAEKPAAPRPSSRTVTRQATGFIKSPGSAGSSSSSSGKRSHPSSGTASLMSPIGYSPLFPPHGPPLRQDVSATASVLLKATQMKDGLLNTLNMPLYAMWKDGSFGIPNRALQRLLPDDADFAPGDQFEYLSQFTVYSEDFSRPLEVEEFPIMEVLRHKKRVNGRRLGMRDPHTDSALIFEISGEPIYDDMSKEFLGGIVIFKDVTEYTKRIAEQIQENERQFETIANMIPPMVWTTKPDGEHDWFSQRWYDYTGLSVTQSLGKGWKLPFHDEDMAETGKRWAHSLATGDEYTTEYRCLRHDGEWRWMLGRASPFRDENGKIVKWFGTCTDIHELVEARLEAKQTREQLRKVIEHSRVTLWVIDSERKFALQEGRLLGQGNDPHPPEVGHGRDAFEVLDSFNGNKARQDVMHVKTAIDDILRGKVGQDEAVEVQVADGDRWYRTRLSPMIAHTRNAGIEGDAYIDGVIGVSMDITELRRREDQLRNQEKENAKLLANAVAAKEASRMKSQFLANVSTAGLCSRWQELTFARCPTKSERLLQASLA